MDHQQCPFCHLEASRIHQENDIACAIRDAFPVAEGHMLVVPKRHVASLFDLPDEEQAALCVPDESLLRCQCDFAAGLRRQAETVFAMVKRRLSPAVHVRRSGSQCRELWLLSLTHNLMIL